MQIGLFYIFIWYNHTGRNVSVELQYGQLDIEWAQDGTVFMTGPAEESFSGETGLNLES